MEGGRGERGDEESNAFIKNKSIDSLFKASIQYAQSFDT